MHKYLYVVHYRLKPGQVVDIPLHQNGPEKFVVQTFADDAKHVYVWGFIGNTRTLIGILLSLGIKFDVEVEGS